MSYNDIKDRAKEIESLAKEMGLDFFPTVFETVNRDIMLEACCYGLPTRFQHWSHGRTYQQQKIYGEMGYSKVYEIVFNSANPTYAFLMDTNSDIINLMVIAHVYGHNHFFKNNIAFKNSDRQMIHRAAARAERIDKYIEQYGLERVEHFIDMCMSIDRHINWNKGIYRDKYPEKQTTEIKLKVGEFDDLLNKNSRYVKEIVTNTSFPPSPEKDLLWFMINYSRLESWQEDIASIIREEAYYFYPIVITKIMNEGFASFFHAEILSKYDKVSESEFIEFSRCHSSVINPGNMFNINPYYLGFKIFSDIRKKWDLLKEEGKSDIDGIQKVIQVASEEDDASFLRNYFTKELAEELGFFNYGYRLNRNGIADSELTEEHEIIELKDRELDKIIDNIIRPTYNYGVPLIQISEVDGDILALEQFDSLGQLDEKYCEKTMEYLFELWGGPVELKTKHGNDQVVYRYDESGFDKL